MTLFSLSKPITIILSGAHGPRREQQILSVRLRPFETRDLPICDVFRGQPANLSMNIVASLSGMSLAQIRKIAFEDFAPIAATALQMVRDASEAIGLPPDTFITPSQSDQCAE